MRTKNIYPSIEEKISKTNKKKLYIFLFLDIQTV